ncbi:zinc-binding dehydrogenase, partial [Bowmanella sp. Y57]|nr:zinc-binding dehydrogenase [Bowmanella yangjiangensis]
MCSFFAQRQPQDNADNFQQLFACHTEGKLKLLVSQTFPLARGGEAIDALDQRKAVGKVVVEARLGRTMPPPEKSPYWRLFQFSHAV